MGQEQNRWSQEGYASPIPQAAKEGDQGEVGETAQI
jgi:hypothetical protein